MKYTPITQKIAGIRVKRAGAPDADVLKPATKIEIAMPPHSRLKGTRKTSMPVNSSPVPGLPHQTSCSPGNKRLANVSSVMLHPRVR